MKISGFPDRLSYGLKRYKYYCFASPAHHSLVIHQHGAYEANRPQVDRRQSPSQAIGYQGCKEVCPSYRRSEEAPQIQAWHRCPQGDQEVPEVHRAADPEAALPETGQGNCSGFQDRPEIPVQRGDGTAGGQRGLPGWALRGHQPMRYPRQEGYHHAKRHPAGQENPRREGIVSSLSYANQTTGPFKDQPIRSEKEDCTMSVADTMIITCLFVKLPNRCLA